MKRLLIKTKEDLKVLSDKRKSLISDSHSVCVYYDNKAQSPLHFVVVSHPVDSLRGIPAFLKEMSLPQSDVDVLYIGEINDSDLTFISTNSLYSADCFKLELSCYYDLPGNVDNYDNVENVADSDDSN